MPDSDTDRMKLGFSNVMYIGEALQALLIRRPFTLTKFFIAPEPEFHPGLWLTSEIQTWGNSADPQKNGFRIKANTLKESDDVQLDIEVPKEGRAVVSISFVHQQAMITIYGAEEKPTAMYLIVVTPN